MVWIPPTAAAYRYQLSMPSLRGRLNEYQQKLRSKRAYHAIHWPLPIHWLAASAGVRLRATGNGDRRCSVRLGKHFTFLYDKGMQLTGVWSASFQQLHDLIYQFTLDNQISIAASNSSISSRLFFSVFSVLARLIYTYVLFDSGLSVSNKDYNNNNMSAGLSDYQFLWKE